MGRRPRRNHSPAFKSKVAIKALGARWQAQQPGACQERDACGAWQEGGCDDCGSGGQAGRSGRACRGSPAQDRYRQRVGELLIATLPLFIHPMPCLPGIGA